MRLHFLSNAFVTGAVVVGKLPNIFLLSVQRLQPDVFGPGVMWTEDMSNVVKKVTSSQIKFFGKLFRDEFMLLLVHSRM